MEAVKRKKKTPSFKTGSLFNRKGMLFAHLALVVPLVHFAIWYVYLNWQSIMLAFGYPYGGGEWHFTFMYFKQFFVEVIAPDTIIFKALRNTLLFFAASMIKMFICYLVSYFFFKKVYLHGAFKLIFMLPSIVSTVVLTSLFKSFITTYGPLWKFLYTVFGYELPPLLASSGTAKWVLLFYTLWAGFGVQMMIFVGAMNRIPGEILESAKLDGCSWVREMLRIVLPLTWETFMIYFILGFAGVFTATGPILYFTGMSQVYDTWTLSFFMFAQTRENLLNYASAIGLILTLLTVPIVIATRLIVRRFNREIAY
ncbi:ABC transporter permease [Clostridia bacterium]|nr:ABC transporter permease [Clostridia bacterium]